MSKNLIMFNISKGFKNIFYKFFSYDSEKINIDDYEVISFDIFDTLLKRNVKNITDVFDLIEREYNIKYKKHLKNFKKMRINAEDKARKNSKNEEITLNEIYDYIDYDNKRELMELECEIELSISCKNYPVYLIYQKCLKEKKKIYFTSDMYLPIDIIKKILKINGYDKYDKIYLSSDSMVTKRSLNLFKLLLKENNLSNNSILHIGDSPLTDFLSPKRLGINSILINNKIKNTSFELKNSENLEYNILFSFINNNICKNNFDVLEKFGYEIFGPILYSFTIWVHNQIINNNIKKIFFLARDAKIIMDTYKELYKEEIPIYYLHISRKSVILTELADVKSFNELFNKYKMMLKDTSKIKDLFLSINLNYENYKSELEKNNIFNDTLIMELSDEKKNKLFNIIKEDLYNKSNQQKAYLKTYLEQANFVGKVAVVDIGWNGTIQYYLEKITKNNEIYGYYYGVNNDNRYKKYDNLKKSGYLFDKKRGYNNQITIQISLGLFEMMFLSTEGSTLLYKKDKNKIIPVYSEDDNKNIEIIKKIQDSAKLFIKDAKNYKYLFFNNSNVAFQNYEYFIRNPTLKKVKMFKNIEFLNASKYQLINNKSLIYYVFHLKQFYIDLKNSDCKIFFLKSVFKIKLPYYKLLELLYYKK